MAGGLERTEEIGTEGDGEDCASNCGTVSDGELLENKGGKRRRGRPKKQINENQNKIDKFLKNDKVKEKDVFRVSSKIERSPVKKTEQKTKASKEGQKITREIGTQTETEIIEMVGAGEISNTERTENEIDENENIGEKNNESYLKGRKVIEDIIRDEFTKIKETILSSQSAFIEEFSVKIKMLEKLSDNCKEVLEEGKETRETVKYELEKLGNKLETIESKVIAEVKIGAERYNREVQTSRTAGAGEREENNEQAEDRNTRQLETNTSKSLSATSEESQKKMTKPEKISSGEWEYEQKERKRRRQNLMMKGVRTVGKNLRLDMEIVLGKILRKKVRLLKGNAIGGGVLVKVENLEAKKEILRNRYKIRERGISIDNDFTMREIEVQNWLKQVASEGKSKNLESLVKYGKIRRGNTWFKWNEEIGDLEQVERNVFFRK